LQAREAEPTARLHVLADHHGNRSPRADPRARGAMVGLTLEAGPDALARRYLASVQALAYGTRHIIEALNAAGHRIERVLMTGGGAKNALSLREHADATGCDLHLVSEEDAVTLGTALLAGTACGAFPNLPAAARAMVRPDRTIRANPARRAFHDAKYRVYRALYDDWRRYQRVMDDPTKPEAATCLPSI
jgi:ribulose kinase